MHFFSLGLKIDWDFMKNIVESLFKSALSSPDTSMYVDNEGSITYKEGLNIVKKIACYLSKKEIKNQSILVPVERSKNTLLVFLGIALSGNCYVPVASDVKEERLKDIIDIANIKYTFDFEIAKIEKLSFTNAINENIDEEFIETILDNSDENHPLYIMFTSGSTGKPKGVVKSHKNMISFVENFLETFPLSNNMKLCNQTPFYFDASSKDIYLSLAMQSTLYIPDSSLFVLPNKILQYLVDNEIEMIMWVPSALINIAKIRALNFIKPTKLKYVFFIGEVFPPKYLNMWITALNETKFVNLYGSTETAGAVLYYEIKEKVNEDKMIPTGKTLKNVKVKLDDGEICISSAQVALGYLLDSEKNKETFKEEDGEIYLHTGDYGEYDDNGNIVFKSRKDYQIKHLGYRIELQDIENTLSSLDYIDRCCCLYDKNKDKIILLVSLSSFNDVKESDIINDAKRLLATYMVPSKVNIIEKMPLNSNGKIDRVKLNHDYVEK